MTRLLAIIKKYNISIKQIRRLYVTNVKMANNSHNVWSDNLRTRLSDEIKDVDCSLEGSKSLACVASNMVNRSENVLSKPPMFTTLRMNTCVNSVENTIEKVQNALKLQYERNSSECPCVSVHSSLPDVLIVPSKGPIERVYELKEIMVSQICGCAVLRGAEVFAQGIIGAPANLQKGDKVSVYADVHEKGLKGLMTPFEGTKVFVGNGIAQYSRTELFAGNNKPSGIGILMTEPLYEAPSLSNILPNLTFPQNLPSVVTSYVLNPQPGEMVLDMCAAPGGKTTHIATLMKNKGLVVALDKSQSKVDKIQQNANLWNLDIINAYVFNSTKALSTDGKEHFDPSHGPPFPPDSFDRILLDGPCSALGQRPCLYNKMSVKELDSFPKLQKNLFTVAVDLLKPGGTLVYSTCTITLEENENLVAWALTKYPELQLVKQEPHLGGKGWKTKHLTESQCSLLQRFDPSVLMETDYIEKLIVDELVNIDTIGFFIAKFFKS